jgi:serine/threonine-protein kinase
MMTPERWARIKGIFAVVAETPRESRNSALEELCGGEQDLQAEIEKLLAQHDEMGGFLEGSPAPALEKTALLQAGTIIADRYQIVELLGRGGMGEVYEAEDRELGERVALKVLRPESALQPDVMDRLRREVQLARRVTHPNVCRVFDLGHHRQSGQEIIFLSMELIKGETLTERLKREGKIAFPEALHIARQLCQALGAAHEAGVLHRDFKCGNVMLMGEGEQVRAVVTDFGIARWIQPRDETQSFATNTGLVVGTPAYMSPEQLMGEKLTAASDLYSLGLVLYEMVTGARPFRGESSWTETLKRLSADAPPPITMMPDLDPRWNRTIMRCLQRSPSARFASAQEVSDSLQRSTRYSLRDVRPWVLVAGACSILALAAALVGLRHRIWAPAIPPQKHVAVIPFTLAGSNPADQATAYSLSESLTGNLARLQASESSLWVVSWKEARSQKPEDMGRAASALGVNLLVTGELERSPEKILLRTEIKDASSLKRLRSQVIEIPAAEVVTLEDTLLEKVAAMLQVQVPPGLLRHLPVDETTVPGAYEFYERGRGYLLQADEQHTDAAISLFQTAIEKDPRFALAYANLAHACASKFRSSGDRKWLDQARQYSTQALSLNSNLASAHLAMGMIEQETGNVDSAVAEFERARQLDPTDDDTLNHLSLAYDQAGKLLQAEALLKDALKRSPGRWLNYDYLGYFYYHHAQYEQAEPLFRAATQLAPDHPLAFYNLGGVYLAMGKHAEAEAILTRAIAIKPTAGAYANLGLARFYQKRFEDAAVMMQKAVELAPNDDRLWYNLGYDHMVAGNKAQATEAFAKAAQAAARVLAVRPNDSQLLARSALYHARLGQNAKALQEVERAGRSPVSDPESLVNMGVVYEMAGQRERALNAFRAAQRAGYSLAQIEQVSGLEQLLQDKRFARMAGNPGR